MKVPFFQLNTQYDTLREELRDAVDRVLSSGFYILGKEVEAFEREFSEYIGGGHAVSVGSGTDALILALRAAGIQTGDEVITVANTFIATHMAVVTCGAVPVFADIDPVFHTIDPGQIESKITSKTRVILPVHLYGHPSDMDAVCEIARRHNLTVIEDACQAHGARIGSRHVGLIGDMGCFSFYPTKNLGAYGDGGMVATRNKEFAEKLRRLRNYGQNKKYYHDTEGINSRLDEIQAAVLRVKLTYLDGWIQRRKQIAMTYVAGIDSPVIHPVRERSGFSHGHYLFVVRSPLRDRLQDWLQDKGVSTQIHYPVPIHRQRAYLNRFQSLPRLPQTEKAAEEILSLPLFPEIRDDQIAFVVDCLNRFHP